MRSWTCAVAPGFVGFAFNVKTSSWHLEDKELFCCCMQGPPGGKSFWFTRLIFTTTIHIRHSIHVKLAWRWVQVNRWCLLILGLICLRALWQNAQRLAAGAQVAQTLTTPVVSVATPSLLAQGLPFSAMPTAYNTGEALCHTDSRLKRCWVTKIFCPFTEYQLTSADITALHALASPGGLLPASVSTWQQQTVSQQPQQQQQQQQLNLASLSNLV